MTATIEEAQIRFEVLVAIDAAVDRCAVELRLSTPELSEYASILAAERRVCDGIQTLLNGLANPDVSAAEYERAYTELADAGEVWGTRPGLELVRKTNPHWALAAAIEDQAIDIEAAGGDASFTRRSSINVAERALAQDREPRKAFVIQRDSNRFAQTATTDLNLSFGGTTI